MESFIIHKLMCTIKMKIEYYNTVINLSIILN